jgi:hypothetical protein
VVPDYSAKTVRVTPTYTLLNRPGYLLCTLNPSGLRMKRKRPGPRHFYSIKSSWCSGSPLSLSSKLTMESRLHPGALTTPVVYHTHFLSTGWGTRPLSTDEVGIAFGLPAWARLPTLDLGQVFPLVPIQIMDACLKGILQTLSRRTPLRIPAPSQATAVSSRTWLPRLQRFLPHSWIDSALVTDKAPKRDDARVPTHLWDQRCSLVLPHTSPALETLRRLLIRVASRHMVDEF